MLKIVLVSPAHPLRGGIAASSERLAYALQEAGHTVVIYSFSLQYPGFMFPGKTQYTDDPPPAGLTIKTRLNSVNPFNWFIVGRAIAAEQPDVIICRFWLPIMGPCLGTTLRVARWFAKKTLRITALVDNIIPHEKRPGDSLLARYFVRACDGFVVMSRAVGTSIRTFVTPGMLQRMGENLIRYAPHPIYDNYGALTDPATARRQLSLPEHGPVVLFFGFIRAYKGLDLLLDALAQTPDIHALVAGESYEDWTPYQTLIDRHGLRERVHLYTDFIPAEQVQIFFSAANLVVQPYKTATQSGISQIAYHFEKPMLVTNVGGLPEIVPHGVAGYVVEPTAEAIAGAMRDFFVNNREQEFTLGVRSEKPRFAWAHLVQVLLGEESEK